MYKQYEEHVCMNIMPTDQNILTTFCSTIQVTKVNFEFRNSSKGDQFA